MENLYHVYIVPRSNSSHSLTKLGLTRQQLVERVIRNYENGTSITLSGRSIDTSDIGQIRITAGETPASQLLAAAERENRSGNVFVGMAGFDEFTAFEMCQDVTDDFIAGPPGYKKSGTTVKNMSESKIFVVHGHDGGLKNAVARFIEKVGLEAVVLHEQPDRGRTVMEKFEAESNVSFAVVLATADDMAASRKQLAKNLPGITEASLSERARQNVVFELGYFVGKLGRSRVLLVKDTDVELPSDLNGVIYAARSEWQSKLFEAMVDAGFQFSTQQARAALAIRE